MAGIGTAGSQPEPVHKIVIRAERWKLLWTGVANENNKRNGSMKNIPYPCSKTGSGRGY